jgi:cytochrome c biogenesis protein CcmG/thiol:disulfide interchange protein DsbE
MTHSLPPQDPPASRQRSWAIAVWVIVLSLLVLLAAGLFRAQQGPVRVGERAPTFELTSFAGESVDVRDLRGQVVVVNFWASWCTPCEQEAADLEQAHQRLKGQGVVFLGVDYVDTQPEALAYLERFGITYLNGPDLGTRISQAFRIRGVPETYIIGRDGRLAAVKIGPFASLDEILDAVQLVLES